MALKDDLLEGLEEQYQEYMGIPRHLIPWFPIIDNDKCTGCKECLKFCHSNVFEYVEEDRKVVVKNPWHCQVYCESCTYACPVNAISFPDRTEVKTILRELKQKYSAF